MNVMDIEFSFPIRTLKLCYIGFAYGYKVVADYLMGSNNFVYGYSICYYFQKPKTTLQMYETEYV